MTKIKLCGMMRECDIEAVNRIKPDYVGFIFWDRSRRCITREQAKVFRAMLDPETKAVGVFVDEKAEVIADLLKADIIDAAQLHGHEDEEFIASLRACTDKPLFQAFRIRSGEDVFRAKQSSADEILVDAGTGCGKTFDWDLLAGLERPYFLAGGLGLENIREAMEKLSPYAVDVSSGIETDGQKDASKMQEFAETVRSYR